MCYVYVYFFINVNFDVNKEIGNYVVEIWYVMNECVVLGWQCGRCDEYLEFGNMGEEFGLMSGCVIVILLVRSLFVLL